MKALYALSGSRVESRSLSSPRVELAPPHLDLALEDDGGAGVLDVSDWAHLVVGVQVDI